MTLGVVIGLFLGFVMALMVITAVIFWALCQEIKADEAWPGRPLSSDRDQVCPTCNQRVGPKP